MDRLYRAPRRRWGTVLRRANAPRGNDLGGNQVVKRIMARAARRRRSPGPADQHVGVGAGAPVGLMATS